MPTLNSGAVLKRCLKSVREQEYDQNKIEIVVADGGSTDGTVELVKQYGGKVITENTGSPPAAKAIALRKIKNELVLLMADDNILPNRQWLKKMVSVFDKEPDITGCYPWRYSYRKEDKILNRYFSLFGVNDPVAYFLKRADRQSYLPAGKAGLPSKYTLAGKAQDKGDYFLVEFNTENLSTVGDNGFLIKRELLMKAQVDEKHFFHIDVNWDLVNLGYNKFAVVKNDIIHASGERFWRFFKKRKRYMENLYLKDLSRRRYFVYKKERDRKKIIAYSLYALTLVLPTIDALRGFLKIPDPAWFLHPLICFGIFWIYFTSVINWQFWHHLGQIKRRFNL